MTTEHTTRELHHRHSDGIDVRMLWHEHESRVVVAVEDMKTGKAFEVEVREGDRALEVFHHPYAYAAWRGVPTAAGDTGVLLAA
jgi:hypothetical protein